LHTGVDERGVIVAHCLTGSRADDASVVGELPGQIRDEVERFTADGAYDKTAVYDLLTARGADLVVPPRKNARVSRHGPPGVRARDVTVGSVLELGLRAWKKQAGYHGQARVENAFYRYQQLIGGRLRGRNYAVEATEVGFAINVLNRMLEPGAPRSEPIHN
nr:transposase [Acidobacteriota bacterium]